MCKRWNLQQIFEALNAAGRSVIRAIRVWPLLNWPSVSLHSSQDWPPPLRRLWLLLHRIFICRHKHIIKLMILITAGKQLLNYSNNANRQIQLTKMCSMNVWLCKHSILSSSDIAGMLHLNEHSETFKNFKQTSNWSV